MVFDLRDTLYELAIRKSIGGVVFCSGPARIDILPELAVVAGEADKADCILVEGKSLCWLRELFLDCVCPVAVRHEGAFV